MLPSNPVSGSKLFNDPIATETFYTTILFSTKRRIGQIVHGLVVDMVILASLPRAKRNPRHSSRVSAAGISVMTSRR